MLPRLSATDGAARVAPAGGVGVVDGKEGGGLGSAEGRPPLGLLCKIFKRKTLSLYQLLGGLQCYLVGGRKGQVQPQIPFGG